MDIYSYICTFVVDADKLILFIYYIRVRVRLKCNFDMTQVAEGFFATSPFWSSRCCNTLKAGAAWSEKWGNYLERTWKHLICLISDDIFSATWPAVCAQHAGKQLLTLGCPLDPAVSWFPSQTDGSCTLEAIDPWVDVLVQFTRSSYALC